MNVLIEMNQNNEIAPSCFSQRSIGQLSPLRPYLQCLEESLLTTC